MIPPLLALSQNRSKLKLYIAHLTDLCHDRDPSILSQLTPPSHYHHSDPEDWEKELQKMSVEQVLEERSSMHCSNLNSSMFFILYYFKLSSEFEFGCCYGAFSTITEKKYLCCFLTNALFVFNCESCEAQCQNLVERKT